MQPCSAALISCTAVGATIPLGTTDVAGYTLNRDRGLRVAHAGEAHDGQADRGAHEAHDDAARAVDEPLARAQVARQHHLRARLERQLPLALQIIYQYIYNQYIYNAPWQGPSAPHACAAQVPGAHQHDGGHACMLGNYKIGQ